MRVDFYLTPEQQHAVHLATSTKDDTLVYLVWAGLFAISGLTTPLIMPRVYNSVDNHWIVMY